MASVTQEQLPLEDALFMPQMTAQAMRDSRYRHPANALAELIDNSVDARAKRVDLMVRESQKLVRTHHRWRIEQIAVFDNGHGMSGETLLQALRFGGHQPSGPINRIGKYGMGLPTASVSQCRKVEVWTWQEDINKALWSYIDMEKVEAGQQLTVPFPVHSPIPEEWINMVSKETLDPGRGTLVVWSDIDRINVQADTVFNQVEAEIGRIYRHYINNSDELAIRMASIKQGESKPYIDKKVRPNDPLYLMGDSTTPSPWDKEPMFEPHGTSRYTIKTPQGEETVEVNYSIAKREALGEHRGDFPGQRDYGRHALKNIGISIVRENREILLEDYYDRTRGGNARPENRWWGCEVRFNSGADNTFGIDHNKQMAANLSRAFKDIFEGMDVSSNPEDFVQAIDADDEAIYRIASDIRGAIRNLMGELAIRFEQRPPRRNQGSRDNQPPTIEETAIEALTNSDRQGIEDHAEPLTSTDRERQELAEQERIGALTQSLIEDGESKEQAEEHATETIRRDHWYTITPSEVDGYRMFSVRGSGGILNVRLNIHNHIYELIKEIDEQAEHDQTARNAAIVIRAMILSWARMEDGTEDMPRRMELQGLSERWGRSVHYVLERLRENSTMVTIE